MAGIHRLQHVQRLRPPDLADDDPVGPHAQGGADQLTDGDFAFPFRIRVPGFERHQIGYRDDLQLSRILDRDHPLIGRDELGQGV
ncbi:hypothetical protein D3C76_1579340 [compost metagenome]